MVDDEVVENILRNYRHLMTESERRADRAFFQAAQHPPGNIEHGSSDVARALADDPRAAELFKKGRPQFLKTMARRILAEHAAILPRCGQCGGILKSPSPKRCVACDPPQPTL
jgi:hypothetical protein